MCDPRSGSGGGRLSLLTFSAALLAAAAAAQAQTAGSYGTAPAYTAPPGVSAGISQSPFTGSAPAGKATAEPLSLTFKDAIARGLQNNLGLLLASDSTIAARGQKWKELSDLLPNVTGAVSESVQKESLAALGIKIPGLPRVIGPFNYMDARAQVSQSLLNIKSWQRERAANQNLRAAEFTYKDARDIVVLAVGNGYLQALAGSARVETAEAQVQTAQALYDKTADQQRAGVSPAIDTLRANVELQSRQQQLIVVRNDFAKEKLALARIIGLPTGQEFKLADRAPYEPLTGMGVDETLQRAYASRADYQAALAQLRAAQLFRKAASSEYLPVLGTEADYGATGVTPGNSNGTYHVAATLSIPIFQGNKVHADVLQAEADLREQRSRVENLRGQIDYDVRSSLLDLNATADQVKVARSSVDLADQTLAQARDRFGAGVTDNLEVVQAQESVATANENYISSLYSYNLAKVALARAVGYAEQGVEQYLRGK